MAVGLLVGTVEPVAVQTSAIGISEGALAGAEAILEAAYILIAIRVLEGALAVRPPLREPAFVSAAVGVGIVSLAIEAVAPQTTRLNGEAIAPGQGRL